MPRFSFSRLQPVVLSSAVLLFAACTTRTATPPPAASAAANDPQSLVTLDQEIAAAGQDPAALGAIATRWFAVLRNPASTPSARQAVCERLGLLPADVLTSADHAPLLVAMLADAAQVNLARLVLDRVPGPAADALYLQALPAASASAQLALVQSIGNRRIDAAVPALTTLRQAGDRAVALTAIKALGQIGTTEALAALHSAPGVASPEVLAARLAAAAHIGGPAATAEFHAIAEQPGAPAPLRAAAVRALLFADPATAPAQFVAALGGDESAVKPVVIEAIATHPSPQLIPALAAHLPEWDAPIQTAVLAALGRRADAAAGSAVRNAARHSDAAVRAAAITALGELPGSPETAAVLARIAAGDAADDAKLARQSLARLNGRDVADAVLIGAAMGETSLREVYLQQIAARYMVEAVPLLLRTRQDPEPRLRAAALGSLAEIAPASTQPAILEWAVAADAPIEQTRALRALAEVTLRQPDVEARAQPIVAALERAPSKVVARLVPVLARIGGEAAAACTTRLALRPDAPVAAAATATLGRWSDRTGLISLMEVAEKASLDPTRAAAIQNATRFLDRARDLPTSELVTCVERLLAVSHDDTARARLAYLLARCSEPAALALAERLATEPALATDAGDAVLAIRSNQAGAPLVTAAPQAGDTANLLDRNTKTRWGAKAVLGQSLTLDFHSPRPFRQLVLDNAGTQWGFPEQLEIFVSDDRQQPGAPRAAVAGQPGKTVIDLPPGTRGRYLVIRHATDKPDDQWIVYELVIE